MEKSVNPLEGSLCERCAFFVHRLIIPFDEERFGINRVEMGISEEDDIQYDHYMCAEIGIDLDHIVLECNMFEDKNKLKLLNDDY